MLSAIKAMTRTVRQVCNTLVTKLATVILVCLPEGTIADSVYYSAEDFSVTDDDIKLYLRIEDNPSGDVDWGSPERVRQALFDVYTLKVLSREADRGGLLSPREAAWIAFYQVALEKTKRLISAEVERQLQEVDWSAEARDYYRAHPDEFKEPATVSVRTLLLTAESRTLLEAVELASSLVPAGTSIEQFADIVIANTEDPAGGDGTISGMKKGQTVPEFEKAAFSLEKAGDISEPVVSRFGVHVIQLLDKSPETARPFEKVERNIVAMLRQQRATEFANVVRSSPFTEAPADVIVHQEQIDAFLEEVRVQHNQATLDLINP